MTYMRPLLFVSVILTLAVSLTGCKSVGYHIDGKSTILRHDTVHVYIQGDKPYTIETPVK